MNHEAATRPSNLVSHHNTSSLPSSVPEAPPLPAPKPLQQRARDAAFRLMGYQSRSTDAVDALQEDRFTPFALRNRFASLGATQNATASHKTGLEINTLAVNEKGTHALIAGKEIFKTIRVQDGHCAEELNIRSAIRSTPTHASGKPRQVYSIDVADVAWGRGGCSNYVAAATSSGKIILYDLGHAGLQAAQLHEHHRQVHRVTFEPHRGNYLLSGSQDGTVRLWDIRDARNQASTLQSKRKYSGQSDGVRDVKWCPTTGEDFAFGTDSGWIQRWDIRNLKAAKLKIPAHSLACNTIDWHQDGKHILSAGLDKTIRFWDFTTMHRQASSWEIKTPYPVFNARWRPSSESSVRQDRGARICTQIVTSYDRTHPNIHLWDLRRPHVPFREIIPYASAPTDLAWHSQDLLWTVGREGIFLQTDVHHAAKILNRRNVQSLAISSKGDLYFAAQRRKQRRAIPVFNPPAIISTSRQSTGLSISPETSVLSRSWADDTLDNTFLTIHSAYRNDLSTSKGRTNSNMSHTTLKLDDVLLRRYSSRPQQASVRGVVPYNLSSATFKYVARHCDLVATRSKLQHDQFALHLHRAMISNSERNLAVGKDDVASTWKIVDFVLQDYLCEKAKANQNEQTANGNRLSKRSSRAYLSAFAKRALADSIKSPHHTPSSLRPISVIAQQLGVAESTSNVPTPLAKPVSHAKTKSTALHAELPDPEAGELLVLPPSLASGGLLNPQLKSTSDKRPLTSGNLQDLQKQGQINRWDRLDMVQQWSSQSRAPFTLENTQNEGVPVRPKLLKHDSDESFAFLGESSDSRGPSASGSSASVDDGGPQRMVLERPSRPKIPADRNPTAPAILQLKAPVLLVPQKALAEPPHQHVHVSRLSKSLRPSATLRSFAEPADDHLAREHTDNDRSRPFTLVGMLRELLHVYTNQQPDAQTAANLITLLASVLPPTEALSENSFERNISHYADTYAALGVPPKDAERVFDEHLTQIMTSGLDPLQLESILSTYHEQLGTHNLVVEAAHLRKLVYPVFPSIFEPAMKDNALHLACGSCGKPVSPACEGYTLRCQRCEFLTSPCPVCLSLKSPQGQSLRFTACLLCGHATHATCGEIWFAEGEGACPFEGCLCDCTVGIWRDQKTRLIQSTRARDAKRHHMRVRSDEWRIGESNAVAALSGMDPLSITAQARASA